MSKRIRNAYEKVCRVLLDQKTSEGYWSGRLSDSALSTATTVSAFCVFLTTVQSGAKHGLTAEEFQQLEPLIKQAADWLLSHQNADGGWGDTDKSISNISTTLLVKAALVLAAPSAERIAGDAANIPNIPDIAAIKQRYGNDQTFSVPILTNAALAGLADWQEIPQLPFELAALPMAWFRFFKMNVVSYAIPALVAIGQVKFHFAPDRKKFVSNFFRRFTKKRTLRLIEEMQPASGGYLEAAPLTAFVVMSLSAMGLTDHPIVTKGIRFLIASFREGGSVPIDTNLATWLTSLSLCALQGKAANDSQMIDWLLSCQHKRRHPFTGASPGGWGWTNLSGAVPDADDTSAALLALVGEQQNPERKLQCENKNAGATAPGSVESAVIAGITWLLNLQNRDGGMPTFCQGWGMLPFDKSSTDITAHAIRALQKWKDKPLFTVQGETPILEQRGDDVEVIMKNPPRTLMLIKKEMQFKLKMVEAQCRMFDFLEHTQQPDGSWLPLWFGNQTMPDDANPFYGTAKVLLAYAEAADGRRQTATEKAILFLLARQNTDGSWGNSVEETAVVVEAFAAYQLAAPPAERNGNAPPAERSVTDAYHRGLTWLLEAVESDRFMETSPIGLYFASLWYYEDLYPIIFTASALCRALEGVTKGSK